MTSVLRNRTRPHGPGAATVSKNRSTQTYAFGLPSGSPSVSNAYTSHTVGNETCIDKVTITSPYEDHDLTLKKTAYKQRLSMSGEVKSLDVVPPFGSVVTEKLFNWCPTSFSSPFSSGLPLLSVPNFSYYETKALARYNARFTPLVDIPLFIFELKDFPRMLRDAGRVLQRKINVSDVPGGYLAEKFGWQPLLSDLLNLLTLKESIDRRLAALSDARAGRRTEGTLSDTSSMTLGDRSTVYNLVPTKTTVIEPLIEIKERAWFVGSVQIQDPTDFNDLISMYEARDNETLRTLFGLKRVSASTIWNAIPWSWLIDYFSTIGDFIEIRGNTMPMKLVNLNLMVHQTLSVRHHLVSNTAGVSVRLPRFVREHKYRRVVSAPSAKITLEPFLTGSQEHIIAALIFAAAFKRLK